MAMANERDIHGFNVGQLVVLHVGGNDLSARIVEDRGNLGVEGGRIFRVAVSFTTEGEPSEFEVPASALDAAPASPAAA